MLKFRVNRFKWLCKYFFLALDCPSSIVDTFFSLHCFELSVEKAFQEARQYLDQRLGNCQVNRDHSNWSYSINADCRLNCRMYFEWLILEFSSTSHVKHLYLYNGVWSWADAPVKEVLGHITAAHFRDEIAAHIDLLISLKGN